MQLVGKQPIYRPVDALHVCLPLMDAQKSLDRYLKQNEDAQGLVPPNICAAFLVGRQLAHMINI